MGGGLQFQAGLGEKVCETPISAEKKLSKLGTSVISVTAKSLK
jgi:hypothetical protein